MINFCAFLLGSYVSSEFGKAVFLFLFDNLPLKRKDLVCSLLFGKGFVEFCSDIHCLVGVLGSSVCSEVVFL